MILEAALEVFNARGYAGATTREIAERSGCNEVLIFRHFGSKAGLFREAMLDPFSTFIERYAAARSAEVVDDPLGRARDFTRGLMESLRRNKPLLMALIAANAYEPDLLPRLKDLPGINGYFEAAAKTIRANSSTLNMNVDLAVRLPFALVAAMVLFDDWLLDRKPAFGEAELVEAAARMMTEGVLGRLPDPPDPEATEG